MCLIFFYFKWTDKNYKACAGDEKIIFKQQPVHCVTEGTLQENIAL